MTHVRSFRFWSIPQTSTAYNLVPYTAFIYHSVFLIVDNGFWYSQVSIKMDYLHEVY